MTTKINKEFVRLSPFDPYNRPDTPNCPRNPSTTVRQIKAKTDLPTFFPLPLISDIVTNQEEAADPNVNAQDAQE